MRSHIVINIDNHFVPQAAAFAASVLQNGRLTKPPVFHVLGNGLTPGNAAGLSDFISEQGGTVLVHDLGNFREMLFSVLGKDADTGKFPVTVLARIFAADVLSGDIERFLYLDADMTVRGSLEELYQTDLCGKVIACCAEPSIYEGMEIAQGNGSSAYFNTGLMLVDRKAWIKGQFTEKCLRWFAEHNGTFDFADQDIINHALAGQILPLDQKYDFFSNYSYQSYRSLTRRSPWYGKIMTKESYEAAAKDPVIVHYAGDERPWYRGNRNPYREEYRKYLSLTPWKGEPEIPGHERYMRFYHAVNVLSGKIPGFRTLASEIYRKTKKRKKN